MCNDNQMATAWQLRNHMTNVVTPASAMGKRPCVRALRRQAQTKKAKTANKPLSRAKSAW